MAVYVRALVEEAICSSELKMGLAEGLNMELLLSWCARLKAMRVAHRDAHANRATRPTVAAGDDGVGEGGSGGMLGAVADNSPRTPQSEQSVPSAQSKYTVSGPPS